MAPVGIALIGAGPWGLTLARAFERVPEAQLRTICDLDAGRRDRARAAHPGASLTDRLDDVLADVKVVAAVVAVDSPRHHDVGLRILESNRHLLVEKPMALSARDAVALHAAATSRRRVLSVGHLLLHHPAVRRAGQIVTSGALGDPLYFESLRETVGAPRSPGSAWWTLAPHDVSLAIALLGAVPATVSATTGAHSAAEHDGVASAVLTFSDGRTAHLHVARFAADKTRRMSIAGTRRTLTFDELAGGDALHVSELDNPAPERVPIDEVDVLLAQCTQFVSAVRREDPTGGNGSHGVDVVRVLEAGARSARAGGAPVDVT